ncbi:MAG TPA: hypothetical protein VJ816_08290 [Gemmatimonadales bacterium]|nr:hypothetical protein [Gemmatimonadales bacterium]
MALRLAPAPKKTLKERSTKVKSRKSSLRKAGYGYKDIAELANVSYWMVWKWVNGERKSSRCQKVYDYLLSQPKRGEAPNGR